VGTEFVKFTREEIQAIASHDVPLCSLAAIGAFIDAFAYDANWAVDYRVKSVAASIASTALTCLDAALLASGLLDLFPHSSPRLMPIHRRGADGYECGHAVCLYRGHDGLLGAFAKSNYPTLGHREPVYETERGVALSYARAYVRMGFVPLYYGSCSIDEVGADLDWRRSSKPLNVMSARLCERYQFEFVRGAP
jgi:hypothetical protein